MKHLIALALIAAAIAAAALPFAGLNPDPRSEPSFESERSFQVAQRRCPNGRC
jgi:hypothetical protein